MSEENKDKIKVVDINGDNFFNEKESYFLKDKKTQSNDNFIMKLVIVAVLLSFILISIVVFFPFDKFGGNNITKNADGKIEQKGSFDLLKKRENILILGVDTNGPDTDPFDKTRTDTMMLVSIDNSTKSVSVISIPRDSKVYIAGHGIDKINAANAVGGVELTIKTVQEMFGIRVDHYIMVNYDGLKEIVKILGTIPVNVDKKLRYNDYSGKLFINLNPGKQELTADQVEQFVRFRHDAIGDIGRVERQRMLMKGVITKLQSPENISKIPEIISVANDYIKTDMNIFDMTRFAGIAKSLNIDDVIVATLPGHPSQNTVVSYWILEPDKVQSIIDRLVYRIEQNDPQAEPLKISLLYNESMTASVDSIKEILKENNMEIVCEKQTLKTVPEIIAHTDKVTSRKYKYMKNILPQLKSAHMTISYDLFYCGESDVTLVLTE